MEHTSLPSHCCTSSGEKETVKVASCPGTTLPHTGVTLNGVYAAAPSDSAGDAGVSGLSDRLKVSCRQ